LISQAIAAPGQRAHDAAGMHQFFQAVPTLTYAVERKCRPQWSIPERCMRRYNLIVLLGGEMTATIDGVQYTLREPGDYALFAPGTVHRAETNPRNLMHCYSIEFGLRLFDEPYRPESCPIPPVGHLHAPDRVIKEMSEIVHLWRHRPLGYPLRVRGLVASVLFDLFQQAHLEGVDKHKVRLVENAARYIRQNYARPIKLADIAAVVNFSPVYFGAVFRRVAGRTPIDYLNQTRVQAAQELLLSPTLSVAEVAQRVGIGDPSYFARLFKKYTGLSPREFRKLQ